MVHLVPSSACTWIHSLMTQVCRRNVPWVTLWWLIFSFSCPTQPPPPPFLLQITCLLNSDDIRVTDQSHGVILKAQHRKTNFTEERKTEPAEIPPTPHSGCLERLLRLLNPSWNFTYSFFFFYKILKRKKKHTNKQTNWLTDCLLPPVRWLTTPDTCFGEDYFLFGGMITDACSCK